MLITDIHIRDPFIMPEKGHYYLYGTTDDNAWEGKARGFSTYESLDLKEWRGPFEVFTPPDGFWADENFWAPEVYTYKGSYYMFASFKTKGKPRTTQILTASGPLGPFMPHSDNNLTPLGWECLDGTLYLDEEGTPYMVFCHEWLQVGDGEICAVRLSLDLKISTGKSTVLFHASEAPWSSPNTGRVPSFGKNNYVTDGPFLYKANDGELLMLWSSYTKDGYAIGVSRSETGKIYGPWKHDQTPVYKKDGGHGMMFKTFDGRLMLTLHSPNETPDERPLLIELLDCDGQLKVVDR